MINSGSERPDERDIALVQQVHSHWSAGNQQAALDTLRERAEDGVAWAAAFMAWLHMQQGPAGINESVNWAIRAAELGAPWQAVHTFNNVVGNAGAYPQLAVRLPELMQWAMPWMGGIDPVGQAWSLISQGQPELAIRIMSISTPWPVTDPQFRALGDSARSRLEELDQLYKSAKGSKELFDEEVVSSSGAISKATDNLTTSARQAGLLVTTVLSDATNALYVADASRNEKESRGAWISGLVVLGLAALAAVLPVTLHYLQAGPSYSALEVIGVHLASTAALGTFAGVLLARARSRDRAAQRSHDLSTAMGTMISYSNQISDPAEKERFMTTMGQVVMKAHLNSSSGSPQTAKQPEDSLPGLLALATALRTTTPAS